MKRSFRIGPGAASLLLMAVVLSMCILGVLSLLNARTDRLLSVRSISAAEEMAALNCAAEASLARLDAALSDGTTDFLPEGMVLSEDQIFWEETSGGRTLSCAVSLSALRARRSPWTRHRLFTELTAGEE